jgi:DNA helicase-2/ATP-dependent DNA helicase PcrA
MDGDGPAPTFPVSATSAPSPASVAVDHGPTASAGNYRYEAAGYVASLTLDPPASTSDLAGPPHLDEDYLILSTVHSAIGLKWDTVHVINVIDGTLPSEMALTSSVGLIGERRLFYVAATRARDELSICTPFRPRTTVAPARHRHACPATRLGRTRLGR